jgi:hypothetical protein
MKRFGTFWNTGRVEYRIVAIYHKLLTELWLWDIDVRAISGSVP